MDLQGSARPVAIFFIFVNILGFCGNITVIFIYSLRYKKNDFRCLVLALAVIDLISCCTTVPMETVSTWFLFDAPSKVLCKAKNFCVQFSATCAIYMIFITAVYKYRRICKPLGKQITQKSIALLCLFGCVFSLGLATPAAVFWDINNHRIQINNNTDVVRVCEVHKDFHGTKYPTIYRHCLSAYDVLILLTIIFYAFVTKATIAHFRRIRGKSKPSADGAKEESTISTGIQSDSQSTSDDHRYIERKQNTSKLTKTRDSLVVQATTQRSKLSNKQIRNVVIMLIIAGSFSLTFFVGLSFGYVFAIRDYRDFTSVEELIVMFVCYRFYFINYALNPVVYFILDRYYREEVLKCFSLLRRKVPLPC